MRVPSFPFFEFAQWEIEYMYVGKSIHLYIILLFF
jgi:hypothetical protein